jgi:fibro-slime domain-containing protein
MKITKRSFIGWICGVSLLLSSNVFSAELADEIWVPVTYYDFHSDGSNPEFEQEHPGGKFEGMVQKRLDKDGLPVPTTDPNRIRLNSYMKYWYRPFQDSARGDNTYPIYNYSTGFLTGIGTRPDDQSFVNLVIQDSLRFVRVPGTNMYRYDTTTFFPLDKYNPPRTFGIERNQGHNYSFTMHLKFTFTKTEDAQTFIFRGDDDVWAFIDSTLVMDLGGIHEPEQGSFIVSDTLKTNKEYSFDLFFAERHTVQSNIRIETNLFKHDTNTIAIEMLSDTACAGSPNIAHAVVTVDGKVSKELSEKVKWTIRGRNGTSTITGNKGSSGGYQIGDTLIFNPTEAFRFDTIIATTYDSIYGVDVPTSAAVYVKPCNPYALYIEDVSLYVPTSGPDSGKVLASVTDSLRPNRKGSITLENVTPRSLFAVVRDKDGNFMGLADKDNTIWTAKNDSIKCSTTPDSAYKGVVVKLAEKDTTAAFVKFGNLIPDSVEVILDSRCIVKLRLKDDKNQVVTSINLTTGDRKVYTVEGLVAGSTDNWIVTEAKWELGSPPTFSIPTPDQSSRWTFDPLTPGENTLHLSRPFVDPIACVEKPELSIPVKVTIETVKKVELTILTPPEKRIAGDTLLAEVRIYNTDGLIPGNYCFGTGDGKNESQQVIYNDLLKNPDGRNLPNPRIVVDGNWTDLNQGLSTTIKHNQCFNGGVDTIKFIAFYAPFPYDKTDSVHTLRVDMGDDHFAQKEFRLRPAKPDRIDITEVLYPFKSITSTEVYDYNQTGRPYTSVIYDRYNNTVVQQPLVDNWYTTGTIKEFKISTAAEFEFYPGVNTQIQTGKIVAKHKMDNIDLIDSIDVRVNTIPAELTKAVTRDTSGNGFIDMLELTFNKEVTLTPDMIHDFKLIYSPTTFEVINIVKADATGTRYNLIIKEDNTGTAKTDLLPVLTTTAGSNAGFKDVTSLRTSDGVAPVVVAAKIVIKDNLDHSNDILTITLSEQIKRADKQDLTVLDIPSVSFSVWLKDLTTSEITRVQLLDSIPGYLNTSSKILDIMMKNGRLLGNKNLINIRAETRSISDVAGNFPDTNNIKVKVEVENDNIEVIPVPNPAVVSFEHTKPGEMRIAHDPQALEYAKNNKGIAFIVDIPLPEVSKGEKLGCTFRVYDHVGNLVFVSEEENIVPEEYRSLDVDKDNLHMDLYWNGSNKKGMAISPGIYKVVFYFVYSMNPKNNTRIMAKIGFKK